jgi:hypothetical protein
MNKAIIGTKSVYQVTSAKVATTAYLDGTLVPTLCGSFGPGFSFVDSSSTAFQKSGKHLTDPVLITSTVDFGTALVLEGSDKAIKIDEMRVHAVDSIKARSSARSEWEYLVFDSSRIHIESISGNIPWIPRTAVPGQLRAETTGWISDIVLIIAPDEEAALGQLRKDFQLVKQQNAGTVYLSYHISRSTTEAIRHIVLEHSHVALESGYYEDSDKRNYTRLLTSLNPHTDHDFVYLSYTKDDLAGVPPVSEIAVRVVGDAFVPQLPRLWEYVCWRGTMHPANMNKGLFESCVHLVMRKE